MARQRVEKRGNGTGEVNMQGGEQKDEQWLANFTGRLRRRRRCRGRLINRVVTAASARNAIKIKLNRCRSDICIYIVRTCAAFIIRSVSLSRLNGLV